MTGRRRVVAVVLAGGVGVRLGFGIPKQLVKIAGRSILEHTILAFETAESVDEIIVMMNPETMHEFDAILARHEFETPIRALPGGSTRNRTTELAIAAIDDDEAKVLLHDAVRPFVSDRIIDDCVRALDAVNAVDTAIESADTIIEVDAARRIVGIPHRSRLRRGQTPQGFRVGTIRRAYELAAHDPQFTATDDCGVVFAYLPDEPIQVVEGSADNMKVTEPVDLHIADKLFQLQSASIDDHADESDPDLTGTVTVVFGGTSGIGADVVQLVAAAGGTVAEFSRSSTRTDVGSRRSVRSAIASVLAEHGRIDSVILSAGVLRVASLVDLSGRDLTRTVRTNLLAPMLVAREVHRALADSQGHLLFFTSSSYTRGRSGYAAYSATKAGVVNLTQALSEEWAEEGIRVNCINPQRTATPMRVAAFGAEPASSLLAPSAVAAVAVRMLGSEATGQIVPVRLDASNSARRRG